MKSNNVSVAVVQGLDSYNTLYQLILALMMMGGTVVYCRHTYIYIYILCVIHTCRVSGDGQTARHLD